MKGVVDIEFLLSVVVFISTVVFVSFIIITNIPLFHKEAESEDLRARTYEISQFLMFEKGVPDDWGVANVKTIGLSTGERYMLSIEKITNMNTLCTNDYKTVKTLLGQDYRTDVKITITDPYGTKLLECRPASVTRTRPESRITRYAVLQDKRIVRIDISVF